MTTDLAEIEAAPEGEALDDWVYTWIRDRIIDGTFAAGERLRERGLSEELGVSRVPIREAFPRLEAEGYIRSVHRRGVVVAPMELTDIEELFTIRLSLEVLAARLAAQRCAEGVAMDRLQELIDAEEVAIAGGSRDEIAEATAAIHNGIVELSGSKLLQQLMLPVRGRVQRLFHIVTERDERHLQHEHRDLCSAIMLGEPERAAALALAHIEHGRYETMPIVRRKLGTASE